MKTDQEQLWNLVHAALDDRRDPLAIDAVAEAVTNDVGFAARLAELLATVEQVPATSVPKTPDCGTRGRETQGGETQGRGTTVSTRVRPARGPRPATLQRLAGVAVVLIGLLFVGDLFSPAPSPGPSSGKSPGDEGDEVTEHHRRRAVPAPSVRTGDGVGPARILALRIRTERWGPEEDRIHERAIDGRRAIDRTRSFTREIQPSSTRPPVGVRWSVVAARPTHD